jgi:uncharacterized protein YchJ
MKAAISEVQSDTTSAEPDSSNSSHSSHFSKLSPVQAQLVDALASGASISAAARQAGVHRTTVHHWLRNSAEFKAAAENARSEYAQSLCDEMRDLTATALRILRTLLEAEDTPPAVRLRAVLAVLQRPHLAAKAWHLPEQPTETVTEPKVDHEIHACEPAAPSIARGGPCPCGSGRKYKRCCGIGAQAVYRATA